MRPWDADVVRVPPNTAYCGHRFPGEIVSQVVWLYSGFGELPRCGEMMAMRGVQATYERVREWCGKFVRTSPRNSAVGHKRTLGSKWHLDEVFLKIDEPSNMELRNELCCQMSFMGAAHI